VTIPINQIICGDNIDTLRTLPDACVDSCVTDPPYGLEFMGKAWDRGVPGVELWREVLRVLRPGGHLLAFAGTRTQHRMATAIEDAGFEVRDMIAWVYGSGFPKSLDVSKAIDKAAGAEREVVGRTVTPFRVDNAATRGTSLQGSVNGDFSKQTEDGYRYTEVTAPATEAAKQWAGWGTALKPALEPITVARKPLCGTVAENVLQHGTGGLNVDGCRVGTEIITQRHADFSLSHGNKLGAGNTRSGDGTTTQTTGRWPANLIHDGSEEVVGLFPETASGTLSAGHKRGSGVTSYDGGGGVVSRDYGNDSGSAARFFYCAKAGPEERRQSKHPTIKPVALMRYLVRLATPPNGLVLDPFGGSGTTAEAARLEHCRFLLMELNPEYCADAAERLRQKLLF
jgi:DNA modification methylase